LVITRTPFRISFFGGGTDYPEWYLKNGGKVLATTIDKYCYISVRELPPFFDHKFRIVYSSIESVKKIDDIAHPSVKAVLNYHGCSQGLEIHHDGDLPARSGLGSSSSFTVGLVHALRAMEGKVSSKDHLAKDAIHIEQNLIGETVGSQDQISVSYGGLNKIDFHQNGTFDVEPVILPSNRRKVLSNHLMLFFTGFTRFASEIAESQINNMSNKSKELEKMSEMVDQAIDLLQDEQAPIGAFGELLDRNWGYKRSLSNRITTPEIDNIYEKAKKAGAIGGKLLGAGGGGFMLLFVPPEKQANVREIINDLIFVPFEFDDSGSRIMLYQPSVF
jgi:D-glycero-alpha-D-manno-heptose-7-phosphate kinase